MFDVGFPELFIVAVLAIVVVGPKDLPKVIRSVMGMIRKVREMGSEFQAGVKKMADEVELDAVTRKLNETGNVKVDEKSADTSATNSTYDEFDYDEYDYDGHNYEPPAPKKEEVTSENAQTDENISSPEEEDVQKEDQSDETASNEDTAVKKASEIDEEKIKSKTDD